MAAPVGPQQRRSEYAMDPDNLDEELGKVPLFMRQLPEEENETLEALQSLVYDGTPEGKLAPFPRPLEPSSLKRG